MTFAINGQASPPSPPTDRIAGDEARHQRLAAEAGTLGGIPAVAFYRTLTIRQLEKVTWDLIPEHDDEAIAARDPHALRRLQLWHAAWVALEEKERRRDQRRHAREARTPGGATAIGDRR